MVRLGGWGYWKPDCNIRQTRKCVHYVIRMHALLCYVVCATFVRALVYCNFLKEVRLGGWGQKRRCVRYYT